MVFNRSMKRSLTKLCSIDFKSYFHISNISFSYHCLGGWFFPNHRVQPSQFSHNIRRVWASPIIGAAHYYHSLRCRRKTHTFDLLGQVSKCGTRCTVNKPFFRNFGQSLEHGSKKWIRYDHRLWKDSSVSSENIERISWEDIEIIYFFPKMQTRPGGLLI